VSLKYAVQGLLALKLVVFRLSEHKQSFSIGWELQLKPRLLVQESHLAEVG
jgi:hypothetical protein